MKQISIGPHELDEVMRVTAEQLQALLPTEDTGMFTIEELLGNPGDFEFSAEDLDENDLPDL